MKIMFKLTALLLIVSIVFMMASCGYNVDIYQRVSDHLAKEYPDKSFDIIDYEKHNETSGRYEVNVRCRDDGIEFQMYIYSSITVTDGYSVQKANSQMEEVITGELGTSLSEHFDNIQWHNIYIDKLQNYRFQKIEMKENVVLADLDSLYEVKLTSGLSESEIGGIIYDFVYALCDEDEDKCSFESVLFIYKIGRVTYEFTTDSVSVLSLGRDGLIHFILTNLSESNAKKTVPLTYSSIFVPEEPEPGTDAGAEDNS